METTVNTIQDIIKKAPWKKSKYIEEHEYIMNFWIDEGDFNNFKMEIEKNGIDKQFRSKKYRYLVLDGYKYWSMRGFKKGTFVINRAKI